MKTRTLLCGVFPLAALFLIDCLSGGLPEPGQTVITIDPTVRYQTISGWEATAQAAQLACDQALFVPGRPVTCPAFQNYRDHLFDLVAYDLGITRLRVEISPAVENPTDYYAEFLSGQISARDMVHLYSPQAVNDNDDPNRINPAGFHFSMLDQTIEAIALPLRERLMAKGEKLSINMCYVGFGSNPSGFWVYNYPEEYAEFVLATYQHMQAKYGFLPDTWEIELEPDNTAFDGTKMGRAIQAAASRLEAAGFIPRFVVPSTTNMGNAQPYFNAIKSVIGDAGVRKYIQEISYHRYAGVSDDNLKWIGDAARSYGIGAAMLEHIGSGYQDLHKDLTLGNNTAWAQFTIAYRGGNTDDGSKYYLVDDTDPKAPKIITGSRTKFLRQYFKFIRPGAVRIQATTSNKAMDPVAFINTDATYVVVVKASGAGSFAIDGLPAATYGIKYTTQAQYDVDLAAVTIAAGRPLQASIPAAGVITVYGRSPAPIPGPRIRHHDPPIALASSQ
jgi:O-glycosyl hydrolase